MTRDYRNPASDSQYLALLDNPAGIPFSFKYRGERVCGFGDRFTECGRKREVNGDKESVTIDYELDGELKVSVMLTHYYSHGATEWTVWFENASDKDSGIISEPKCELVFEGKHPMLKGIMGDHINKYCPYAHDLQGNVVEFSSDSGRATHICFPYFNLEFGGGGALLAIGWAGTWQARFCSDGNKTTCTVSSVNGLCTYLKPGEKIRTALFAVLPYTVRNESYATNLWRSWFIVHNMPRADADGNILKPFSTYCFAADTGRVNSDGSISETKDTWRPTMEKMIAEDVKVDFRWLDAGWYVAPDGHTTEPYVKGYDWWDTVGTWELDPAKWPGDSFKESTDFARANGMKTLVWFEPERVTHVDGLVENYGYKRGWGILMGSDERLRDPGDPSYRITISNNIGDPECLKWTTDRICKMLRENKVEMYREDNNCNAAMLWEYLDSTEGEGRRGITECKFIYGHYKMWDDIIACTKSYGGCGFVDSCASGGGRNDLESMRRGIPLLRSDNDRTTTALRLSMTHSFNKWIPFSGASTKESVGQHDVGAQDTYVWRSSYLAALNVTGQLVQDPDFDFDNLRSAMQEWKRISPYMLGEFYTLTPWHSESDNSDFTAFCYFDPKAEEGVILAFRQEKCQRNCLPLSLPFAGGEEYILTDEDSGEQTTYNGGTELHFTEPRSAKVLWVKKK